MSGISSRMLVTAGPEHLVQEVGLWGQKDRVGAGSNADWNQHYVLINMRPSYHSIEWAICSLCHVGAESMMVEEDLFYFGCSTSLRLQWKQSNDTLLFVVIWWTAILCFDGLWRKNELKHCSTYMCPLDGEKALSKNLKLTQTHPLFIITLFHIISKHQIWIMCLWCFRALFKVIIGVFS